MDKHSSHDVAVEAVSVVNGHGSSPYLLICEHASNFIPEHFERLGLSLAELSTHIAWDPGAIEVARGMSALLNATLIEANYSRLLIDCNRPLNAPDLIPQISERTVVPGNQALDAGQCEARILLSHRPFHQQVSAVIAEREARGQPSHIITIHSFTPVYKAVERPWHIGIIHDADDRLAAKIIDELQQRATAYGINIGVNEPYSPDDRVYYTVEQHTRQRGALGAMVEIRNNEIASHADQQQWAQRLAQILQVIEAKLK